MEEQVRDNEAWDLLLFAVVYELAPDNLEYSENKFFATKFGEPLLYEIMTAFMLSTLS